MVRVRSYVLGRWVEGADAAGNLVNPSTEEVVGQVWSGGYDAAAAAAFAREHGGPALRSMTFAERAELLLGLSRALHQHREELIEIGVRNGGGTRGDAKFDIDGATGTLAHYAELGQQLGARRDLLDGDAIQLGRSPRFVGQHLRRPRHGVAVHINAFNFPAWGTFEKAAVAWLAGMPVLTKAATATSLLAHRMAEIAVESGVLPAGAFSFLAGSVGGLFDALGPQDVVAFTGSAATGLMIRGQPNLLRHSVRVNVEADSLNAAVLGPDVAEGDALWHLFLRYVTTDITQKTGQKCTAVRRVMVPRERYDAVCEAIAAELRAVRVGDPSVDGVKMGPVATAAQLKDVRAGIARLTEGARIVTGGVAPIDGVGAPAGKGYFVSPTLLAADEADRATAVHEHEVFGPSATVIPYDGQAVSAAALVARGQGSLVSSVYTDDAEWLGTFLEGSAPWNGRVLTVGTKVADQTFAPGLVLPSLLHGGPGRAGGGEELGGVRGMELYLQRTAIEGDRGVLGRLLGLA